MTSGLCNALKLYRRDKLQCFAVPCAGKLRRASQRAHSKQEIVSILDDMFPPTNSAAKTKLLKDAFAAVFLGHPYKVC